MLSHVLCGKKFRSLNSITDRSRDMFAAEHILKRNTVVHHCPPVSLVGPTCRPCYVPVLRDRSGGFSAFVLPCFVLSE
jgi:hypothetical protein